MSILGLLAITWDVATEMKDMGNDVLCFSWCLLFFVFLECVYCCCLGLFVCLFVLWFCGTCLICLRVIFLVCFGLVDGLYHFNKSKYTIKRKLTKLWMEAGKKDSR